MMMTSLSDVKPVFAYNAKLIRNQLGLGKNRFGELLGVNGGNIYTYEAAVAMPPVGVLVRYEELSGFSIKQLVTKRIDELGGVDRQVVNPMRIASDIASIRSEMESMAIRLAGLEKILTDDPADSTTGV